MDALKSILTSKGAALRIADDIEIIAAIAQIRENWQKLKQGSDSPTAVEVFAFIEQLVSEDGSDALVAALDKAQLAGKKLRSQLEQLSGLFEKIDEKYHPLVLPTGSFDETAARKNVGLVEWQVVGVERTVRKKNAAAAVSEYTLDLGAKASLVLEAGDTWPGQEPDVPDPLLRIGFGGALDVAAKARLPLAAGALKLAADAAAEAFIDYYFDARADDSLYARSVVRRLDHLPNPWSLTSVMKTLGESDFVGSVLETTGRSAFSVGVSVAEGFALPHELEAGLQVTFDAKIVRSGSYYLKLRRLRDPAAADSSLEVTIERKRESESERALSVGVEIDIASLGKRLLEVLKRHEGALQDVLADYRAFLTPGTYLRAEAAKRLDTFAAGLVSDAALRSALADALQRTIGVDSTPSDVDLGEFAARQIAELFDGASGVVTGAIDTVAAEIAAKLVDKLGVPADSVLGLANKLSALVQKVRDDLEKKVSGQTAGQLQKLLDKLDAAGAKVAAAGARADRALAGVRDVISRYEQALDRLKAAVADSARMKLSAKILAESSTEREQAIEARLIFKRPSASAERIYRDVVRGDFDAIMRLMEQPDPDVSLDPAATSLLRFRASGRKTGYALVLVGFELGGFTAFDTKSKVLVEGTGKVSVMSELTWKRRTTTPREEREVSFVDVFELSAARHTQDFSIDLAISHEDEVLKRRELEKLIGSFERAALVPPATTTRALALFTEWFGPGAKKGIVADVNFALRLESKQVARLLCLAERAGNAVSSAGRRRVFGIVLNELIEAGDYELEHVKRLATAVLEQSNRAESGGLVDVLFAYTQQEHRKLIAPLSPSISKHRQRLNELDRASDLHTVCMSFVELIDLMGDVFEATPGSGAGTDTWSEEDYDNAQREIARQLKSWLKTGSRLFWIAAEAHPRTLAFVGGLAALAEVEGTNDRGIMALTMTRRAGEPVTVTLC